MISTPHIEHVLAPLLRVDLQGRLKRRLEERRRRRPNDHHPQHASFCAMKGALRRSADHLRAVGSRSTNRGRSRFEAHRCIEPDRGRAVRRSRKAFVASRRGRGFRRSLTRRRHRHVGYKTHRGAKPIRRRVILLLLAIEPAFPIIQNSRQSARNASASVRKSSGAGDAKRKAFPLIG